ncbi:ABC transporter substrate-binding protein [Geodermatophilus sp. FMUSA9-8]|uniref:ABC transporter substrate-binding protein n=1 Tax=Geodermatophilus sp. FMUSA9-8 TaxID=3120155 RepID=UPI003009091E
MTSSSRRLVSFVAAATVATTLAACGGGDSGGGGGGGGSEENEASDIGITEDTIKLGAHYPLTGVAAPGYSEIPTGVEAYFDYVNANGGVNGRQIEFVYRDDAYNPTNTSQIVNQLVLEDEVFAIMSGLGTPTHNAVTDFLNSEGVPDLFVSSGSRLWDDVEEKPYTFGWQPDYEIEGKIIGQYVAENFPDARVGLFLQGDDFGEDGAAGARQYLEDQIVAEETYVPGNTDVVPQISALQAAGADLVLGFNVPSYTALSQLTALRLGYDPQWFYSNVGSDPALVGSLLARFSQGAVNDASLLDGALTTEYIPGLDAPDNPWVQLWQQVWEESGQEGELTNYRIYGMSQAYTMVQALQSAGQNPTRDDLVAAVEQAGAEWEGPGFTPFRYSEDRHAGYSGMLISRIQGQGSEDLTPVLVTDNGDAEIEEQDGEPAGPPENGIPEEEPIN